MEEVSEKSAANVVIPGMRVSEGRERIFVGDCQDDSGGRWARGWAHPMEGVQDPKWKFRFKPLGSRSAPCVIFFTALALLSG